MPPKSTAHHTSGLERMGKEHPSQLPAGPVPLEAMLPSCGVFSPQPVGEGVSLPLFAYLCLTLCHVPQYPEDKEHLWYTLFLWLLLKPPYLPG